MSKPETRGQTVGTVMSGLLMGIMLARPVSSLVADALGWHAIFVISAIGTTVLALVLRAQAAAAACPRMQLASRAAWLDVASA
jgi:predicted MFS family arabinose efflux permease